MVSLKKSYEEGLNEDPYYSNIILKILLNAGKFSKIKMKK